jgi:MarR family transcriptional regulator, organic hydroperoxide resistance regulator
VKDQFTSHGIVVDNAIGFWIQRVYQSTRNEMYRLFREEGGEDITPEQWMVLIRLWERDERTQADLCEATSRDAPTMSRIVDGMERRHLLSRKSHPDDGRVRVIHLTRKGRELEKKLVPIAKKIVTRLVRGIPEEDLTTTRATLKRMFENLA